MDVLPDLVANAGHLVGALVSFLARRSATVLHIGFSISDQPLKVEFGFGIVVLGELVLVLPDRHFILVKLI